MNAISIAFRILGGALVFALVVNIFDRYFNPWRRKFARRDKKVTVRSEPLPCPRRRIKVPVINFEGERLFEADGIKFDRLEAYDEFIGGQLTIMRNGETLDRTTRIGVFGTHESCTGFCGLEKIFGGDLRSYGIDFLNAQDFEIGDIFILDVPLPLNFDFAQFLQRQACFSAAMDKTFHAMPVEGTTLGEFNEDE